MSDPSVVTPIPFQPSAVAASFTCTRSPGRLGAVWFDLTGELDLSCAHLMDEQLSEAVATFYLVAVDLRELDYIDCAGLGLLVAAAVEARRTKKSLVLIRGSGQVDRMLEVAGLLEWFEVVDVRAQGAANLPDGEDARVTVAAGEAGSRSGTAIRAIGSRRGASGPVMGRSRDRSQT